MRLTSSVVVAATVAGVAAQDGWRTWSTCPSEVTITSTEIVTAYEKTVTVPLQEKPSTLNPTIQGTGKAAWEAATAKSTSPAEASSACQKGKTITAHSISTTTMSGTKTITKSILFVGAQITGDAQEYWDHFTPQCIQGSATIPANVASNTGGNSNINKGPSTAQGNSAGNGNLIGDIVNGVVDAADSGLNGLTDWGKGSWGGKGIGGLVLGVGDDVFHWTPKPPSNTKSGVAPVYTKGPKGWKGPGINVPGSWNDWQSSNSDGSESSSGSSSKNGTIHHNEGTYSNSTSNTTSTSSNDFGCPSSNVTAPFEPLKENICNGPSDRSSWCNGLSIDSNYYDLSLSLGSGLHARAGAAAIPSGGTCSYDLTITDGTWNMDGDDVPMFLINGQYPGPAIECNWGDLVTINVHNQLESNGTTVHWHGIRQVGTNDQDGVPGVTECAVAPGESRTYTWTASSYGTGWYHSHWNLQYGDGVAGPIIIHGPATADYDVDFGSVMIADTFGGLSATAFGYISAHQGPQQTDNYLLNGKNVKADLSAGQHPLWQVQKGKKYRFRLINSAAQNMYSVSIDQHKMTVIAADFVPITPYETDWINIGIGQRYDVVVEMDQDVETYFFRAVTQTLCPSSSVNSGLGQANGIIAYEGVAQDPLPLPTSTTNGGKTASDFQICYDEPLASLVPHLKLGAGSANAFQQTADTITGGEVQKVQTDDDGDVYRWFLNNGAMYVNYTQPTLLSLTQNYTLSPNSTVFANQITLRQKNQWVYFVIQNQYFASHPMHLHGHDFSLLGQGNGVFTNDMVGTLNFDNPMRRDTAMLAGASSPTVNAGWTVIGFETDNPGAWLMHCHIAWHVDGGLALQFIERPDDMASYGTKADFQSECSAYGTYEAESTTFQKVSGESGLRRRGSNYFDKVLSEGRRSMGVVRRDTGARHHLSSHAKRTLGDGLGSRMLAHRAT